MEVAESTFLGEMVATGQLCPCSGWWVCAHDRRVAGGRRRYVRRGERMPPVELHARRSVLDLFRPPPAQLVSSVWSLVDYEEHLNTVPMGFAEPAAR